MKKRELFHSFGASKGIRNILIMFFACFISAPVMLFAQGSSISILFYNVENLFYPEDDTLSGDDEFIPDGIRRWTWYRYHQKITSIARVIIAANAWEPPDIVGLCEIENDKVLRDLVNHPLLRKHEYFIIHRDSPDHRGIDASLLYRKDKLKEIQSFWITPVYSGKLMQTRELLFTLFHCEKDTLLVSMNHWTSKYGGAYETEGKRIQTSIQLIQMIDSLQTKYPDLPCLIGGDFNDLSDAKSIQHILQNDFTELHDSHFQGSYKFQGKWQSLDHAFLNKTGKIQKWEFKIIHLPFLLEHDKSNTGLKPYRTYSGYQYNGGVSDHLPVLVILQFREEDNRLE